MGIDPRILARTFARRHKWDLAAAKAAAHKAITSDPDARIANVLPFLLMHGDPGRDEHGELLPPALRQWLVGLYDEYQSCGEDVDEVRLLLEDAWEDPAQRDYICGLTEVWTELQFKIAGE